MPFWRMYYHLVWATRNRQPLITPQVEARLFPYLVNKAAQMQVTVYAVNGWVDHVHMVVAIPPKWSVADVMKELKGASSHDINSQTELTGVSIPHFAWQGGYGALTMGENHRSVAVEYVQRQKEHHASGQTNYWLERCDDANFGPVDQGMDRQEVPRRPRMLREAAALYGTEYDNEESFPF